MYLSGEHMENIQWFDLDCISSNPYFILALCNKHCCNILHYSFKEEASLNKTALKQYERELRLRITAQFGSYDLSTYLHNEVMH